MEEEIVNNNDNKQENMEISEETIQVVEQSKLDISEIASFKDIIELSIIIIVAVAVAQIYLSYKKILNKRSREHYENNVRNKKFIEDIYVEIGETNEKARYFIKGKTWKNRIKNSLNNLMSKNNKKLASKIHKIKGFSLEKKLKNYETFLEKVKANKGKGAEHQNELWFLDHNSYYYREEIKDLREKQQIINSRILFILGKAGSGKTNLATYLAKVIGEKEKYFCIYINAKDIRDGNIEEYLKKMFYTNIIINKDKEKYIFFYLKILNMFRRKFYIIIEALNENPDSNFIYNLTDFINKYSKYKNMRFIVTSRTEFFDVKYKNIIDEQLVEKHETIEMDSLRMNETIKNKMIEKYKNYYNYFGKYNERVKSIIEENPILMRIFFETYKDTNEEVDDINKYTLFWNYIKNVQEKTADFDVKEVLYKIGTKMLELNKYDYINTDDIDVDKIYLEKLINENVLLSNSIVKNENTLGEEINEVLMFTFDELRDFIISKVIVDSKNDDEIVEFIKKVIENQEVIAEGTYRNLYLNFKINQRKDMCSKFLNSDIIPIIRHINPYRFRNEDNFENFILDIIFENNLPLYKCEIDYINNTEMSERDAWKIIRDLWKNTLNNREPNFNIVTNEIEKILKDRNKSSFIKTLDREAYEDIYDALMEINNNNAKQLAKKINDIIGALYEERN